MGTYKSQNMKQEDACICNIKELEKRKVLYVSLKALLPVCMKYTAQGESRVANIAPGKAECYIFHETLTKNYSYISYKRSSSALSVLLYFTLLMCE